jgi:small subunit ribosomal protein S27Ae
MQKRELYSVEGDKLVRGRRSCPRCGSGVFLAEHADRYSCGKCGYTEIRKEPKQEKPKTEKSTSSGKKKQQK